MSELYRFHDVSKHFDGPENLEIFKNINMVINEGESLAIVGASGSGKSTLLHLMGALDTPSSGRVLFDGKDMAAMSADEKARFRRLSLIVNCAFDQFNQHITGILSLHQQQQHIRKNKGYEIFPRTFL